LTTYDITNFATLIDNSNFDRDKETTFYIYGTMEATWVPTVVAVRDAYLTNKRHNFVIVGNRNLFFHTFINAPLIADRFSTNIIELIRAGYDISKINFVGFSLGAKAIAPLASRQIARKSGGRYVVPRIVALDPGTIQNKELYLVNDEKLRETDADFVMTIHTDCRFWGSNESLGHVNFWINGCDQPNCVNDFSEIAPFIYTLRINFIKIFLAKSVCNHLMAPVYWAEAVRSDSRTAFKSRKCANYKAYMMKDCDLTLPVAYIGLYTDKYSVGDYYVRTKVTPPYSRSAKV
jgi:Lipase